MNKKRNKRMERKELYKRIKENKNDDFEDKLLKRELYKSMINKDAQNTVDFIKTPTGKLVRMLSLIIVILIILLILK